jgi:hypothetical protein
MDWRLIIGLATLVLVIFTIVWGTGLWTRREKVKIKITKLEYTALELTDSIMVWLSCDVWMSGGKDIRYITGFRLKPDEHTYSQLCNYFDLPKDGLIKLNQRIELRRDEIKPTSGLRVHYPALPAKKASMQEAKEATSLLTQERRKVNIGLVWDDSSKTTWKKISKENYGKWV